MNSTQEKIPELKILESLYRKTIKIFICTGKTYTLIERVLKNYLRKGVYHLILHTYLLQIKLLTLQ